MFHYRKAHRLRGYDYSRNGAYYITIVCRNRENRFGDIVDDEMVLNDAGKMVYEEWSRLPVRFSGISLDAWIVMPNHVHGIIELRGTDSVGARPRVRPNSAGFRTISQPIKAYPVHGGIGDIICAFKSITTNRYARGVSLQLLSPFDRRLWQRDYWDHIIRNEREYDLIREYIVNNPRSWEMDRFGDARDEVREERNLYNGDWQSLC
ncbi:MAG: transposase [Fibrobacterota bacterium]